MPKLCIVVLGTRRLQLAAAAAKSRYLCLTLCDGSPLGSSVPGMLQTRILEQVAISFSAVGCMQYFSGCLYLKGCPRYWHDLSMNFRRIKTAKSFTDIRLHSSPRSSLVVTFHLYVLRLSKHIHCRRSTQSFCRLIPVKVKYKAPEAKEKSTTMSASISQP